MIRLSQRLFCAFAGLFGACGIGAYAASAHIGGYFATIAPLLLGNAAALLALALTKTSNSILRFSGNLMIIGVLLFTIDMMAREYTGHRFFPFAAPIGGAINIIAWLLLIIAGFIQQNEKHNG